jgi:hypothetical protein
VKTNAVYERARNVSDWRWQVRLDKRLSNFG